MAKAPTLHKEHTDEPACANLPAQHAKQEPVLPAPTMYRPAMQRIQLDALEVAWVLPAVHWVQLPTPLAEKRPAAHCEQVDDAVSEKVPAMQ